MLDWRGALFKRIITKSALLSSLTHSISGPCSKSMTCNQLWWRVQVASVVRLQADSVHVQLHVAFWFILQSITTSRSCSFILIQMYSLWHPSIFLGSSHCSSSVTLSSGRIVRQTMKVALSCYQVTVFSSRQWQSSTESSSSLSSSVSRYCCYCHALYSQADFS